MKKFIAGAILTLSLLTPMLSYAATRVGGYMRKNGTYVKSYYRSDSNSRKSDNYSSRGNYNPYTGKAGTRSW